jgi:hypothetical protein
MMTVFSQETLDFSDVLALVEDMSVVLVVVVVVADVLTPLAVVVVTVVVMIVVVVVKDDTVADLSMSKREENLTL